MSAIHVDMNIYIPTYLSVCASLCLPAWHHILLSLRLSVLLASSRMYVCTSSCLHIGVGHPHLVLRRVSHQLLLSLEELIHLQAASVHSINTCRVA